MPYFQFSLECCIPVQRFEPLVCFDIINSILKAQRTILLKYNITSLLSSTISLPSCSLAALWYRVLTISSPCPYTITAQVNIFVMSFVLTLQGIPRVWENLVYHWESFRKYEMDAHQRTEGSWKCIVNRTVDCMSSYSPNQHFKYQYSECPPIHSLTMASALNNLWS